MAEFLKKTVKPSGGDYTSLEACMNANEQDLTGDGWFTVEIDGTWSSADTSAVTVHNYTTTTSDYINIYTTTTARHKGIYSTSYYLLYPSTDSFPLWVSINSDTSKITINGLQVDGRNKTGTYGEGNGGCIHSEYYTANVTITNNLIRSATCSGIDCMHLRGSSSLIANNIVYSQNQDAYSNAICYLNSSDLCDVKICNNTCYGFYRSFYKDEAVPLYNNLIMNAGSVGIYGAMPTGSNNATYDGSGDDSPLTNGMVNYTTYADYFVSVTSGSEDFHLKAGSPFINKGADLSGIFTNDIIGTTRPTFPTTSILDNFNRANEGPPPTGWITVNNGHKIVSNQLVPNSNAYSDSYWNTSYGPDMEAYVTIVTKESTGNSIGLQVRVQPSDSYKAYYLLTEISSGASDDTIKIKYWNGSTGSTLATYTQEITNGDSIGISAVGSTITAWYKSGAGAWIELGHVTDTSETRAGYIELFNDSSTPVFDDFGGGNYLGWDIGAFEYFSLTNFSRGDYSTLPATDSDLENIYTSGEVAQVATDDGDRVSQSAIAQYAIHQYKTNVGTNTSWTFKWNGQSSMAPSTSAVKLQIYDREGTTWDDLDEENGVGANTDFDLTATVTTDLDHYKDAGNVVTCRVYQQWSQP